MTNSGLCCKILEWIVAVGQQFGSWFTCPVTLLLFHPLCSFAHMPFHLLHPFATYTPPLLPFVHSEVVGTLLSFYPLYYHTFTPKESIKSGYFEKLKHLQFGL